MDMPTLYLALTSQFTLMICALIDQLLLLGMFNKVVLEVVLDS